jgi:hypothetical protein
MAFNLVREGFDYNARQSVTTSSPTTTEFNVDIPSGDRVTRIEFQCYPSSSTGTIDPIMDFYDASNNQLRWTGNYRTHRGGSTRGHSSSLNNLNSVFLGGFQIDNSPSYHSNWFIEVTNLSGYNTNVMFRGSYNSTTTGYETMIYGAVRIGGANGSVVEVRKVTLSLFGGTAFDVANYISIVGIDL